jgi:hypothetical protein
VAPRLRSGTASQRLPAPSPPPGAVVTSGALLAVPGPDLVLVAGQTAAQAGAPKQVRGAAAPGGNPVMTPRCGQVTGTWPYHRPGYSQRRVQRVDEALRARVGRDRRVHLVHGVAEADVCAGVGEADRPSGARTSERGGAR